TTGQSSKDISSSVTSPTWVKLTRSGNSFTAEASANGTTWTTISTISIAMGSSAYIGLAVTSHTNTQLNTAKFDSLSWDIQPAVAAPIADVAVNEDAAPTVINLAAAFTDPDIASRGDVLTYSVTANTNSSLVAGTIDGSQLTLTYAAQMSGSAAITVRATDTGGLWIEDAFNVTVAAVNDLPSMLIPANQRVRANCGEQALALTGITAGPLENQELRITAASSDPSMVPNPTVVYTSPNATGTLKYTPAPGKAGVVTIGLELRDAGLDGVMDTADDGIYTGAFSVTVDPLPAVTGVTLNGSAGRGLSGIDPSGIGVRTVTVNFSEEMTFTSAAATTWKVAFDGNTVVSGDEVPLTSVTGSGTSTMVLSFAGTWVVDTWVQVKIKGDGSLVSQRDGARPDGTPNPAGSGCGYIYSPADFPTGLAAPGSDAVFYVGSLRGDFGGDGAVGPDDRQGFRDAWLAKSLDADFRGVGFGVRPPDGRITNTDIDGFNAVYQAAVAAGRHLDALPVPLAPQQQAASTPLLAAAAVEPVDDILAAAAGKIGVGGTTGGSSVWQPTVGSESDTTADGSDVLAVKRLRPVFSDSAPVLKV
ncbi:MAG: hypothetical protein NTX87_19685, partial [Planctomycetota bacterium]|nr:hypothetical protein [Planctomycetota bacterium]